MTHTLPPVQTVSTGLVVAIVGFFSSFPIVLQGLGAMGASPAQAASGLMMAAVAMGLAAIVLSLLYRQTDQRCLVDAWGGIASGFGNPA